MNYFFTNLIVRLRAICWNFADEGKFGHNYKEYEGMGQAAVNHLLETKSGQVRGAFFRYDTGPIDIVWGEIFDLVRHTGYGIAHILDKHGKSAVDAIGNIIKNGTLKDASNGKLKIVDRKMTLILTRTSSGKDRKIVISCFDKNPEAKAKKKNPIR